MRNPPNRVVPPEEALWLACGRGDVQEATRLLYGSTGSEEFRRSYHGFAAGYADGDTMSLDGRAPELSATSTSTTPRSFAGNAWAERESGAGIERESGRTGDGDGEPATQFPTSFVSPIGGNTVVSDVQFFRIHRMTAYFTHIRILLMIIFSSIKQRIEE